MPETITLAFVGGAILTEGIKFLYTQGGELLKRWYARNDAAVKDGVTAPTKEKVEIKLPDAFEGQLVNPEIDFEALGKVEEQLSALRRELSDYSEGVKPVDPKNEDLVAQVDALRQLLEAVYQQRFTLKGEKRPSSGPIVGGRLDVTKVLGYVAFLRAKNVTGSVILDAHVVAGEVEKEGTLVVYDLEEIKG